MKGFVESWVAFFQFITDYCHTLRHWRWKDQFLTELEKAYPFWTRVEMELMYQYARLSYGDKLLSTHPAIAADTAMQRHNYNSLKRRYAVKDSTNNVVLPFVRNEEKRSNNVE